MSLQAIGALMLSVHHASIVTLQATPAYKLIENQMLPQNCAHSLRSCRPLGPLLDPSVECYQPHIITSCPRFGGGFCFDIWTGSGFGHRIGYRATIFPRIV